MQQIDTREYLSMLQQLVEEGQQVGMTITGTSMEPFLKDRCDEIYFHKPQREIQPGDMVFFKREDGQYVMHRVCRKRKEGYFLAGDHQCVLEGPIAENQIFAIVTEVKRNGKWMTEQHWLWKFYSVCWRYLFPIRGILLKTRRKFIQCKVKAA